MNALLTPLLARLPAMQLSEDPAKNKELHEAYVKQLVLLQLYAKYGEAEAAFKANKFADVLKLLGPVVIEIKANKEHPLKTNLPLAQVMLSYALRAAIQENKLEQARDAIRAMQMLTEDGGDASLKLLRQLPVIINKQMEELHKGNDPVKLKQATDNFVVLIDDLTKDRKLTPELILTLVHVYAKMDLHPRAIDLLNKFPQAKEGDKEDEKFQHAKQIMMLQELRATKDLKPARTLLNEILGTKQKPGWGARNLDIQLENIQLYLAEEDNYNAYNQATTVVKSLGKGLATADVTKKAAYFEVYYLMVLAQYRFGEKAKEPIKKTNNINNAAKLIDQLEGRYADFGDEASARRFKELLEKEADLKEAYEAIKKNKPAGK